MNRFRLAALVFALLLVPAVAITTFAADDPISGSWSGNATAAEGGAPLKLTLKLEGEVVTGQIASDQGAQDIKDGTWKEGVLTFSCTYNGVPVVLKGSLKESKLAGEFTYNQGEVLGTWEASRVTGQ